MVSRKSKHSELIVELLRDLDAVRAGLMLSAIQELRRTRFAHESELLSRLLLAKNLPLESLSATSRVFPNGGGSIERIAGSTSKQL